MARVGVGLIGAGKHGQRYAQHLVADVPALRLAALCRRDATRGTEQARALGCAFHADWRRLVDDPAVEAVVAVVPPTLNPAIAAAVAGARKPFLVEKPLATTAAAAGGIARTIAAAGIPCLMAQTLRWNGVVQVVRERLPALGPLRALVLNQRFEPSVLDWLDDPAVSGGGILLHTGVHGFDLVRYLTGRDVVRVWCRTARVHTRRTEDHFVAILELAGDPVPLVSLSASRATGGRSGMIDVAGAAGQLVADHQQSVAWAIRGVERTPIPLPDPVPTVREVLRAFARLLVDGEEPPVTLEDGVRAVAIAEACRDSADADGRPIRVSV